jgi:hypothetical protein
MTHARFTLPLVLSLGLLGCGASAPSWTPLSAESVAQPDTPLLFVGHGECERLEDGKWVRRPELDYEFSVEQHRRGAHWSSVKTMRRRHPAYDGSAGPRSQTYFFELDYAPVDANGQVPGQLVSSLGKGSLLADPEFRTAVMEIRADVSRFAPFDRYKITQSYQYERGRLEELVELRDGDQPWVRNREVAQIYRPHRFDSAPTRR